MREVAQRSLIIMPLSEEDAIDESIDVSVNVAHRQTKAQSHAHADEGASSMSGAYEPFARNYLDQNEHADHNCRDDRKNGCSVQEEADVDQPTAECSVCQRDRCGEKHRNENEALDKGV